MDVLPEVKRRIADELRVPRWHPGRDRACPVSAGSGRISGEERRGKPRLYGKSNQQLWLFAPLYAPRALRISPTMDSASRSVCFFDSASIITRAGELRSPNNAPPPAPIPPVGARRRGIAVCTTGYLRERESSLGPARSGSPAEIPSDRSPVPPVICPNQP